MAAPGQTRSAAAALVLILIVAVVQGCSIVPGSGGSSLVVQSSADAVALAPTIQTSYYLHADNNTADIYLSDLPFETLVDPAADLRSLTGNIVHIHLFLMPIAGRTPIESSAFNITIRHVVLAGDRVGLYAGGGFMLPDREPGRRWFGGSVRNATVRLSRADRGFADRLGVATTSGTITARRSEERARAIGARLDALISAIPEAAAAR